LHMALAMGSEICGHGAISAEFSLRRHRGMDGRKLTFAA